MKNKVLIWNFFKSFYNIYNQFCYIFVKTHLKNNTIKLNLNYFNFLSIIKLIIKKFIEIEEF